MGSKVVQIFKHFNSSECIKHITILLDSEWLVIEVRPWIYLYNLS